MPHTDIGQRLKTLREKCGKSAKAIADLVEIPVGSYYDLEDGNDWFQGIELIKICSLALLLGVTTPELLVGRPHDGVNSITLDELKQKLVEWLEYSNIDLSVFEKRIGWEVESFLKDSATAREWNIDCLKAVCQAIGVDWTDVSFCK